MTNPNTTYKRLGDYIREVDVRNSNLSVSKLVGLTIAKAFIPSVANTIGTDLSKYKIIKENQFACSLMQVSRDGKMPIAIYKGENAIMSLAYPVFEVYKEGLLPDYLQMWFSRPEFDREAVFYAVGGVRGSLDWNDFMDMMLPVPSLDEQQRIVDRYNAIKNRIETNKQTIAKLEEAAQALYRKMFVDNIDPENLPDGWRMGTLGDVAGKIIAGTIPKYDDKSKYLVLGQKCNKNGTLDLNLCKRHIPKDKCTFLHKKDILINSTGDGTLGRVGQIWFEPDYLAFDSNMTLVRPLDGYAEYLGCVLLNKQEFFVQISQGSTNQTRLYCSMIKPVSLIIPTNTVLCRFSEAISPLKEQVYLFYKENDKLTELLSLLMVEMG